MGRTERAPKGTAGLQGVQGGLSPEWSTRGKELMPTERCQTLPCAAARARSGVGKSLLIRRGKTNAPQRPSENHRASQGWGLSTAPPMAAPAYKQGQPPNPGGMQREGPAELRGPPRTPNANSSEFCGTFPSPSSGPTWDVGGCCPTPTPVWGPRPAGMGTDCYGDAAQGHTALPPHSAPAQRSTHTAPGSGAAHPHPKPIGCRGGAVRKAPQLQLPQWHRGADGSHGVGRSTWIFPPPPPCLSFPPDPQLSSQPLRQQLRRALRTPHSHPMDGDRPVRGSGHFPYNAAFGQTTPRGAPGGEPKPQSSARPPGRAVGRRCPSLTSSPRRAPHPKRSSSPGGQHCEPATSMAPRRGHREDGYGALIATTPRSGAAFGVAELFGAAALFGAVGPGALFHRGCEWAPATPPPVASTNGIAGA